MFDNWSILYNRSL